MTAASRLDLKSIRTALSLPRRMMLAAVELRLVLRGEGQNGQPIAGRELTRKLRVDR